MPLERRKQLCTVVESPPNSEMIPVAGDAVDILESEWTQTRPLIERQPASATLSRGVEAVGISDAGVNYAVDFKGSGTNTTEPDYSRSLSSSGMLLVDIKTMSFGTGINKTIQVGDKLTNVGGAVAICVARAADGSTGIQVWLKSGTFTSGETITSAFHGGTITPVINANGSAWAVSGKAWVPCSLRTVLITLAAGGSNGWTASEPAAGEAFTSTLGGVIEGMFIVASAITSFTTEAEIVWGKASLGATLASSTGKTGAVHASTKTTGGRVKALTLSLNRGGLVRFLVGSMSNAIISADAGGPGRIRFEAKGRAGTVTDASAFTGTSFATTTPPRLVGGYGLVEGKPFPIKSFEFNAGNEVVQHVDGNVAEAVTGGVIVDRDPRITFEVDQVGKLSYDFWTKWSAGTLHTLSVQMGTTPGNRMSIVARTAQIAEFVDGEQQKLATHRITHRLRLDNAQGDDEFIIAHT